MARQQRPQQRESWGIVEQLPSGRYRARYTHDERRYSAPTTFDTKGDAREYLAGVRSDIARGRWRDPRKARAETFKGYALAWIEQRVVRKGRTSAHLRETTKHEYRRYLDRGLAPFADERLANITPAQVRAWHFERSQVGATAAALEARLLHAVLATAVSDGILERNPVEGGLLKTSTGKPHRTPTPAELDAMLASMAATAPRLRLALVLAAYGGLRLSEWRALRRRDLTFDGERYEVHVTRQAARSRAAWDEWIVGPPKSAEGLRVVKLPAALTDEVGEHLEEHVGGFPDSLVFTPAGAGAFLDDAAFYRHWNKAREAAGVRRRVTAAGEPARYVNDVQEHDLRAYAATRYTQAGATMREVQALLGHSTIEAAMRYQRETGRAGELADRMLAPREAVAPVRDLDTERKARA